MERSYLLAVQAFKILNDLPVAGIVHIHIGNKEYPGQFVFLTYLPRLLGSDFNTCFTGNYNDSTCSRTNSLLNLSYKIKISGSI